MREIIDEQTLELVMNALAVLGPVCGAMIGAIAGALKRNVARGAAQGFGIGCFGILNLILWRFYSWMVRYDPVTGYVGLHRVSVLLINVAVFIAVGVVIGLVWGLVASRQARDRSKDEESAATEPANG